MLDRFKPYLPYLGPVRGTLVAATFFGILYGVFTGLGLPLMQRYIFPRVFDLSQPPSPAGRFWPSRCGFRSCSPSVEFPAT